MRRIVVAAGTAAAAFLLTAAPALACGGLVAPDGDVRLDKATTFVAWHDGVEHYVTSFAYTGAAADVGWIVPLPAVPSKIEAAGRGRCSGSSASSILRRSFVPSRQQARGAGGLRRCRAGAGRGARRHRAQGQRLEGDRLVCPQRLSAAAGDQGPPAPVRAGQPGLHGRQIQQLGRAAARAAVRRRRPAAHHHAHAAAVGAAGDPRQRGCSGECRPLPADRIKPLTTENGVPVVSRSSVGSVIDSAKGFTVAGAEPMNASLHHDLSIDRNMSWVPASGYLTYLTLNAPGADVTYDLGVNANNAITLTSFGSPLVNLAGANAAIPTPNDPSALLFPMLLIAGALLIVIPASVTAWRRSVQSQGWCESGGLTRCDRPGTSPRCP